MTDPTPTLVWSNVHSDPDFRETWQFEIEGGGTAEWRRAGITRYWGRSAAACEPLVIPLTDFVSGE